MRFFKEEKIKRDIYNGRVIDMYHTAQVYDPDVEEAFIKIFRGLKIISKAIVKDENMIATFNTRRINNALKKENVPLKISVDRDNNFFSINDTKNFYTNVLLLLLHIKELKKAVDSVLEQDKKRDGYARFYRKLEEVVNRDL